jgi:hypothetical protein
MAEKKIKNPINPKRISSVTVNKQSVPYRVEGQNIILEIPWLLVYKEITVNIGYWTDEKGFMGRSYED